MPAILDPGEWGRWLDPGASSGDLQTILRPYFGALAIRPVSRAVISPANDTADLLSESV